MGFYSAAELRAYFDRTTPYLRRDVDAAEVHQTVEVAAGAFEGRDPNVVNAARAVLVPRMVPPSNGPVGRTPAFDEAVEHFLFEAYAAIERLEAHEAMSEGNAGLTRLQCRDRVLAWLAPSADWISNQEIERAVGLSETQVHLALEKLYDERAVEARRIALSGGTQWMVRMTSHGRDLAEGVAPVGAPVVINAGPTFNQSFQHSHVANAGAVSGNVTQNINPAIAEVVAALSHLQGVRDPEAAAVVAMSASAEDELRVNGWSDKAKNLLAAVGNLAVGVKSAKPAYDLLQPLAAAHGVHLPPWPTNS